MLSCNLYSQSSHLSGNVVVHLLRLFPACLSLLELGGAYGRDPPVDGMFLMQLQLMVSRRSIRVLSGINPGPRQRKAIPFRRDPINRQHSLQLGSQYPTLKSGRRTARPEVWLRHGQQEGLLQLAAQPPRKEMPRSQEVR
ncbi:hypothetical protein AGIG_G22573 [Arapaima gigas]